MAASDKLIDLNGLAYYHNTTKSTNETVSTLAEAMVLMQQWMAEADARMDNIENAEGGSVDLSSLFEIDVPDTINLSEGEEAADIIANALNLGNFNSPINKSSISWKRPTIVIPSAIEWSDTVDDFYDFTADVNIGIKFDEAGVILKTVTLKKTGPGKIYAAKLSDVSSLIRTSIPGNYSYRYHCKGHANGSTQCVLADAFVSSTERAGARILGGSNKLQSMWYTNKEILSTSAGMDFRKMFEMTVGANYAKLSQGTSNYSPSISGHTTSGSIGANITLMGSDAGNLGNSTLCFAEILDGSGSTIAYFAPYKIYNDEIVIIDTHSITSQQIYDIVENGDNAEMASRIYRPESGYLIEVTQIEDEAA